MRKALPLALMLAALAGCYAGNRGAYGVTGDDDDTVNTGGDAGPELSSLTGVPCDVAQLIQTRCIRCHNDRPLSASSLPLMTYANWVASSPRDGYATVGELAISRINDDTKPMPPAPEPRLTPSETQTLSDWVSAGMPQGECGGGDAGIGAGYDAGPGPYETPTVCTSGNYWTRGNRGSWDMRPGGACIDCHSRSREGPLFDVGGTVYPSAHEPDDCNGTGSGITVVITDSTGWSLTLVPTASGNFGERRTGLIMPYTAKVMRNGLERAMTTPTDNGDCNSCHTENGNEDAPGRIMAP